MKVSIITPTFNRPELLKNALESISKQTFKDFEVILVNDGGSPVDHVIEKSNIKDKVKYIQNKKNLGLSRSLNIGLENAEGELIAYLDDDDIYYPHHIETLHDALSTSGYHFAYSKFIKTLINPDTGAIISKDVSTKTDYMQIRLLYKNLMTTNCVMHYKSCLEKSGMFDENLKVLMDWELWLRMSEHYPFLHIDNITCEIFQRDDKSNMSSNRELMDKIRRKIRNKLLKKLINQHEILAEVLRNQDELRIAHGFLIKHFRNMKKKGVKKTAVFGASHSGQLYVNYLKKAGIDVLTVLDNDQKKQGKKLENIIVRSPENINKFGIDSIVIASRGFKEEIYQQIKKLVKKEIIIIKE